MRSSPPLLAPVFRSDAQARILSELLLGSVELSVRELSGRTGLPYATTHDEVARLRAAGILVDRTVGRARLISANPTSALVRPLREILLLTTGPVALLSEELAKVDGVERAFLYGSFAARSLGVEGPPPSDIDLMVIGHPAANDVYDVCARVEKLVSRPVNATILTSSEYDEESGFLNSVRASPIVPLIGDAS